MQGGTTSILLIFFNDALLLMIPFVITTLALIIVDLYFGIEAARVRAKKGNKERVRASTALRRTVNKLVEYTCWIVLGASLAVAFKANWIHYGMMAMVITNEMLSIIDNYFFVHGKKVTGLFQFALKVLGRKLDVDTSDITIEELKEEDMNINLDSPNSQMHTDGNPSGEKE